MYDNYRKISLKKIIIKILNEHIYILHKLFNDSHEICV